MGGGKFDLYRLAGIVCLIPVIGLFCQKIHGFTFFIKIFWQRKGYASLVLKSIL